VRARRSCLAIALAATATVAIASVPAAPRLAHVQSATPSATPSVVTVYRCIGADGGVSLRDTPCPKGERQQARTMVRPTDATTDAPAPASAPGPGAGAAERPAPRIVVVREPAPAPMYECTTPDNTTYTSDSPEGNPRWVPMWTLGWPVPAGTWVRDTCRAMPQAETCARLRDRRAEIERRFFNAMPSERARLELEERGLDARLDADCGGH
jgi:hypothetical protein